MAAMRTLFVGLLLAVPAPAPQATMNATCEAVTFTVTGYPEGSMVFLWGNSQMPFQFIVGQAADWYTTEDGGGSGTLPMGGSLTEWDWAIDVALPDGTNVRPASGHIACPIAMTEPIVEVETVVAEPVAPVLDLSPWANVALAPPW